MEAHVRAVTVGVAACCIDGGLGDVGSVDLAAGTFLGYGDGDGPRPCADVEHHARVAAQVYTFERKIDDALGI